MAQRMRLTGAAAVALLISGCGFHLQGRAPLPDPVKTPYLEVPDRQSDFVQSLRRALLSNGAHLARDKGQASAVVSIVKDNLTRRVTLSLKMLTTADAWPLSRASCAPFDNSARRRLCTKSLCRSGTSR